MVPIWAMMCCIPVLWLRQQKAVTWGYLQLRSLWPGHNDDCFDTAAYVTVQVIKKLKSHPLPADQILNINVPAVPLAELKGIQVTRLGRRHKAETMTGTTDPGGVPIYWYGSLGPD